MKGSELSQDIQHRFHTISKLSKKVILHFEHEAVHELREEIKKMHAFLGLLGIATDNTDDLKIKKRLKSLYGYIGIIHSIQLQQHYINSILPVDISTGIKDYLDVLHAGAEEWKKAVVMLMNDHMGLDEEKNVILKALPNKISKPAIRGFVRQQAEDINTLLIFRTVKENDLHALRKVLKNVLYNWNYIKPDTEKTLPKGLSTYGNIHAVTDVLNAYGDQCRNLDFLQPNYTGQVEDAAAQEFFQLARLQLEKKKGELKNEFFILLLGFRGVSLPTRKDGIVHLL